MRATFIHPFGCDTTPFRFLLFSANGDRPPPFPVKTLYMVAISAERATTYRVERIVRRSFFVSCMPVHASSLWYISRKRKYSRPNDRSAKRIILRDPRPALGHNFCIGRSPAMAWRQFGAKIEKIALRKIWKTFRGVSRQILRSAIYLKTGVVYGLWLTDVHRGYRFPHTGHGGSDYLGCKREYFNGVHCCPDLLHDDYVDRGDVL